MDLNNLRAGKYRKGVIIAFPTPTRATIGRIPYRYTLIGIPTTTVKMETKMNPLTKVVINPAIAGLKEKGLKVFSSGSLEMDLTQTSYSTVPSIDIEIGDKATNTEDPSNEIRAEGLAAGVDKFFNK